MAWPSSKNEHPVLAKNHAILQRIRCIPQWPSEKKTMDNINNNIKSLKINAELAFDEHKFRKATQYLLNVSNPR